MSLHRVVITRGVPGTPSVPGAEVVMAPDDPRMSREELLRFVAQGGGADVIVSMFHDRVDAELLDAAAGKRGKGEKGRLKGVVNFAVGYDNIDLAACRERGVVVANTPDAVTEGTANLAWGLILAAARRIFEGDRHVRSGAFERGGNPPITGFLGVHLTGQNLLIVGAGRIGKAVALRGLAFGMRVLYAARGRHLDFEMAPLAGERIELDEGLRRADVVSVHTPLTPETRHLIDARRLALLKPTAVLVNTARGPVIDEAALVEALRSGRLFGAGLDVFEHEPRVHPGLLGLENAVLTPHIGSAERYWREQMTRMVCENAAAILAGRRPPNEVGG